MGRFKKCPFCKEEIQLDAVKCKHCGEWLNTQIKIETPKVPNGQTLWHLALLSVITFGLYDYYWFYRNWKHFRSYKSLDISVGWRTFGLFIPIYGYILKYRQFDDIKKYLAEDHTLCSFSPIWSIFGIIALDFFWKAPFPFSLLTNASVIVLILVQKDLNRYWNRMQHDVVIREKLSDSEKILVVCGGILWSFYLLLVLIILLQLNI